MKRLKIRPVDPGYDPGYPRFTGIDDWEKLIAPTSARLFRPHTLLFAGLLGGSMLVRASAAEPGGQPGEPLRAGNARAADIANAALMEVSDRANWFKSSDTTKQSSDRTGNPPIVVPQIRISFGNSYVGVFDTARAKRATLEMFAAYGVKLRADHPFRRHGVELEMDGYDPERKIGFEIVGSDSPPMGFAPTPPRIETDPAKVLDEKERVALETSVKEGRESLFLPPVTAYPNMDGDQYTPLRAYLQSAIDYLEWLKAEGRL